MTSKHFNCHLLTGALNTLERAGAGLYCVDPVVAASLEVILLLTIISLTDGRPRLPPYIAGTIVLPTPPLAVSAFYYKTGLSPLTASHLKTDLT